MPNGKIESFITPTLIILRALWFSAEENFISASAVFHSRREREKESKGPGGWWGCSQLVSGLKVPSLQIDGSPERFKTEPKTPFSIAAKIFA